MGMSRQLWAPRALLLWAAPRAACGDMSRFQTAAGPTLGPAPTIKPNRVVQTTPASEKEHERILASYGGAYDDPKMEALVTKTVDRLVAVSDHPDQAYRVTILNSGAVNAFALPTGQLYVTRGLIALANHTSEWASVISHEMAHVIAKPAAQREEQARQVAIVDKVVTDMGSDPEVTAFTIAKNKISMANFSRTQELEAHAMRVEMSSHAHFAH